MSTDFQEENDAEEGDDDNEQVENPLSDDQLVGPSIVDSSLENNTSQQHPRSTGRSLTQGITGQGGRTLGVGFGAMPSELAYTGVLRNGRTLASNTSSSVFASAHAALAMRLNPSLVTPSSLLSGLNDDDDEVGDHNSSLRNAGNIGNNSTQNSPSSSFSVSSIMGMLSLSPVRDVSEIVKKSVFGGLFLGDGGSSSTSSSSSGLGLPTSLCIHPRFSVIGTARGLLVVTSPPALTSTKSSTDSASASGQGASIGSVLKCVISRAQGSLPLTTQGLASAFPGGQSSDGAVTSIDSWSNASSMSSTISTSSSTSTSSQVELYIAAGYASGRVALIDVSNSITNGKASVLKVADGQHKAAITCVRFISTSVPTLLSIDAQGVVNVMTFAKVLGLRWSVESKTILDGSKTGPVLSMSVLLPPLPSSNTGSTNAANTNTLGGEGVGGSMSSSSSSSSSSSHHLIALVIAAIVNQVMQTRHLLLHCLHLNIHSFLEPFLRLELCIDGQDQMVFHKALYQFYRGLEQRFTAQLRLTEEKKEELQVP
jgi:hypothetical protein